MNIRCNFRPMLLLATALVITACGEADFPELDYDPSEGCELLEREARIVVQVLREGAPGDVQVEVYEGSTVSCGPTGATMATPGEQLDTFALDGDRFERRYDVNFVPPVVPTGAGEESTNSASTNKQESGPNVSEKAFTVIAFADLNGNGLCDGREAAGSVTVTPAAPATLTLDRICPIGRL